jgi:hypothetical protein
MYDNGGGTKCVTNSKAHLQRDITIVCNVLRHNV